MLLTSTLQTLIVASATILHSAGANDGNLFMKEHKIIGGKKADSDRYPYTVALTTTGSNFFCGGSLIAPDVVLTAAHCLRGDGISYKVAVGKADLTSKDGEIIRVEKEIRHPKYSWMTDKNDFGLLILSQPVKKLSEDSLVRINGDASYPAVDEMARTMGWGDTDPDGAKLSVSYDLLEVNLPVISNEECKSAKGSDNGYSDSYENYIYNSMICTFSPGEDACQGDSGGPLIIPGSSASQDVLVGVVSWGIGCATKVFPGVFARVSHAYKWISETVCEVSEDPPSYLCEALEPTEEPTKDPTPEPTPSPTKRPTPGPTKAPITSSPTLTPSEIPTDSPTTASPTLYPSNNPTELPTHRPSSRPTLRPSGKPSTQPSVNPTTSQYAIISQKPSLQHPSSPSNSAITSTTKSSTPRPTINRKLTQKPISVGGNSLLIPISSLMSSPEKASPKSIDKATPKSIDVDVEDDEYEFSASTCLGNRFLVGMLLSGMVSVLLMF